MQLLIKSAKIVDPSSPFNGKTASIFIEDGIIKEVRSQKSEAGSGIKIVDLPNLHVAPGFFDLQANFCDPGFEYKEDLLSGCGAAAAGGFTGVAVVPGTFPPIHTKSEVEYIKRKTAGNLVDVFPLGAVSHKLEGKELAEMYDMHCAGAIAFSDDKKSVADAGLMLRALLYVKSFNGLLITHCDETTISLNGQMHEEKTSAMLGLKGIPAVAEEAMVARNIFLCEYTGGRIHFPSVSTVKSVELIREAKRKKLKVTASVNAHHLALGDFLLKDFDTNYKVNPPLRSAADIASLKKGLADGTIDAITSDHRPEDEENKKLEFDYAAFGITGLETAFALANQFSGLKPEELVKKLSHLPRQILGIPIPKIKAGEKANLTLFNPALFWKYEENNIRSRSKNSPFIGKKLKGKIIGVINNGRMETIAVD